MGGRRFTAVLLLAAAALVGSGLAVALTRSTVPAPSSTAREAPPAPSTTPSSLPPPSSFVVASGSVGPSDAFVSYMVEVEPGADAIAGVDAAGFAGFVDSVLTDPRGWSATVTLRRVDDPAAAQLRIVLATPATVDALCAPLRTGGRYSCAQGGVVAINAATWFAGEPASGLDVAASRVQLLNHELGHALGHRDVRACPAPATPAPVMLQQAVGIGDCTPNAWPHP